VRVKRLSIAIIRMHVHNIDDPEIINSSSNSKNTTKHVKIGGSAEKY
jgi:hypothetical protein